MRTILTLSIAAALATGAAYAADKHGYTPQEQARLDKALAGRVAGQPQSCVNLRDLGDNEGFGDDTLLFRGQTGNRTIYLNRSADGCGRLGTTLALKVRTPSTRLCRGDIVEIFDPVAHIPYGSCGLGDFTPYTKVKAK